MKIFLKVLLYLVIAFVVLIVGFISFLLIKGIPTYKTEKVEIEVSMTEENIERGAKLAGMVCASCHRSEKTGRLSGQFMADVPPEFGVVYSPNITKDKEHGIGNYTNGELAYLLRTGIKKNGEYAPPYMPKYPLMSDEDLEAIIAFLRSDHRLVEADPTPSVTSKPSLLVKALCNTVMKPYPYPETAIPHPSLADKIEYGRYIVTASIGCAACHSASFETYSDLKPEKSPGFCGGGNNMLDFDGNTVLTPNITFHESGLSNWTEEEFIQAVKFSRRPDGTMLQYPMIPFSTLTDEEVRAIYAYLKTVPPIDNMVARKKEM